MGPVRWYGSGPSATQIGPHYLDRSARRTLRYGDTWEQKPHQINHKAGVKLPKQVAGDKRLVISEILPRWSGAPSVSDLFAVVA